MSNSCTKINSFFLHPIEVPKNFCEIDARDKCTDGKCVRYDPKKFAKSPSMMTYFPGGRLGNMLTSYLTLLWLKLEFGYDTYYEKESYYVSKTTIYCLVYEIGFLDTQWS